MNEDDYNRIKKVIWGDYIRSYDDIEGYSVTYLQMQFKGIDYFDYYDVYKEVTFDDVKNRFKEHFVKENSALSVVKPI